MSDDITQKLRVTMPDFKGLEISCPCRIRSSLMTDVADKIERQARHIEELREKIDAERSCACAFDAPGDVCVAHSPALMQAQAEVERLRAENARLRAQVAEYFREPATHPVGRAE